MKIPKLLSGYLGSKELGGSFCCELETDWAVKFGMEYAVAVNSATSGLLASCMAIDMGEDDEVIVSPYTMSATAAAPAVLGAKIVFADIEDESFTLDPLEVANAITPKTKAVIVTNLFGHPAYLYELRALCDDHGICLIEDNAQAIMATEHGVLTGTIGHMGVFSLNVHKHIQTGEGGVVVTSDDYLAKRLRGAMNHGEMRGLPCGLNLRMTEVTAMMAINELRTVDAAVAKARGHAKRLLDILGRNKDIRTFPARQGCVHSYYCLPIDPTFNRKIMIEAGAKPYVSPLYNLPAFKGSKSDCPVADLTYQTILVFELCQNPQIESIGNHLESIYA